MQIEGKLFPTKRSASAQKLVPVAAPLPEETCYAKTLFLLFRSAYVLFYYRCLVLISIAILLECKQYFIHCIIVKIYDFLFYVIAIAMMC